MTVDVTRCYHCKVYKDTKGKGDQHCQRCNVWKEILKPMDLPDMDIVPNEVIEQYPDLHEGKINTALQAISKLSPIEFIIFCQSKIAGMTYKEMARFWRFRPYCTGYTDKALKVIVDKAIRNLAKIVKK